MASQVWVIIGLFIGLIVACSVPIYDLNLCWTTGNKFQWNMTQNIKNFIQQMRLKTRTVKCWFVCPGFHARVEIGAGWCHDDVIKWKHFPCYWSFVRGIHRSPLNSPQRPVTWWRGALMFSLIRALNKRLSKQSWGRWFETQSRSLWRHCNAMVLKMLPLKLNWPSPPCFMCLCEQHLIQARRPISSASLIFI